MLLQETEFISMLSCPICGGELFNAGDIYCKQCPARFKRRGRVIDMINIDMKIPDGDNGEIDYGKQIKKSVESYKDVKCPAFPKEMYHYINRNDKVLVIGESLPKCEAKYVLVTNKEYQNTEDTQARVVESALEMLPIGENKFDKIIALDTIHRMIDLNKIIKTLLTISQGLTQEGVLFYSLPENLDQKLGDVLLGKLGFTHRTRVGTVWVAKE